jgi:hypothetical protein
MGQLLATLDKGLAKMQARSAALSLLDDRPPSVAAFWANLPL